MNTYKAKKHSDAVKLMTNYHVNMCGYKMFESNIESGVFSVASKEDGLILTLLDDKTIIKTNGYRDDLGFVSNSEYQGFLDEYYNVASMASQDE